MSEFVKNENFLNPLKKASFAQNIIGKEQLAQHLEGMGLMKYFKKFKMLDKIYERLEKIGGNFKAFPKPQTNMITLAVNPNINNENNNDNDNENYNDVNGNGDNNFNNSKKIILDVN